MEATDELAHGGDIIGDIGAITHSETNNWTDVSKYKENFTKSYGIAFADAVVKAPLLPNHVVRMFNIRASVNDLDVWQERNAQEKKAHIGGLIEDIVEMVLNTSSEKVKEFFEDEAVLKKTDEVDRLFTARD